MLESITGEAARAPSDDASFGPTLATLERRVLRRARWRPWRRTARPVLVAADLVAITAAMVVTGPVPWHHGVVVGLAALTVLTGFATYRARLSLSVLDDLPVIAVAALAGVAAELAWRTLATSPTTDAALLARVAAVGALIVLGRAVAYAVVRQARRRGLVQHRALVLGAGQVGRRVATAMREHPEYGLVPVGFLDEHEQSDLGELPAPLLGHYDDLARTVRREGVSEVVVAFAADDPARVDADLVEVIRQCDRLDCEIFTVPRLYELHHRTRDMDELWGIPLTRARRATWRSGSWRAKRILDVLLAALALVVLSPLMLAVALAVRLENGPSVLFRQVRVGLDGEPFTLLKFRSLSLAPEHGPVWSINDDARLGPVGRVIRATSLDELPQLINILRGEMSIVGPRPERPAFVAEFTEEIPRYTARHRAPAGLTGLAQVNGLRGDTSIEERARFDNYYIQNWSLWLDAKIIARTVSAVLLRRGS